MTTVINRDSALAMLGATLDAIPMTRAMQVELSACDASTFTLTAPLAPNVNDKGCAFGGSLASVLTLSGWGLVAMHVAALGLKCDIFVQDSAIKYLAPVWTDIVATATLATGESWESFAASLRSRGKGRLRLSCSVMLADNSAACALDARFVAIVRSDEETT